MATRSRGLSAGFGWLNRGIRVGFNHPKPVFGGAFFVVLAALVPSLISMSMQFYALHSGRPPNPMFFAWTSLLSMLLGLLVLPLYAGYLQVVDAAEQGLPARAGDIIKPYREGKALRLIGYGMVMLVIYLALLATFFALNGGGIFHWYAQVLLARAHHLPPPAGLPDGFWKATLLAALFGIFMIGFYSIGLGQVTLRDRSVFGAVGDGVSGALKNLLPLLMLAIGLVLAWIVIALCFGIVAMVIVLISKLLGSLLMLVLLVPLYLALLFGVFTAMFGVMYYLWRDVCGDDAVSGTTEAIVA